MTLDFAVVVPMANESADFQSFVEALGTVFDQLGCGRAYLSLIARQKIIRANYAMLCLQKTVDSQLFGHQIIATW